MRLQRMASTSRFEIPSAALFEIPVAVLEIEDS